LFLGSVTFSDGAEAKTSRKTSHSKVKKYSTKKHHKTSAKVSKVAKHKHKKLAKKVKVARHKKKMIAKTRRASPVNRKIASVTKPSKHLKAKRRKSNLPKEYGTI
jgi:indole-3-glycerol phosphate synthase